MQPDLDTKQVAEAYGRWAPVYDLVFGPVFEKGRREAILAAGRVGGRVLEVGVGTGISLPDYPATMQVVGVDISAPMLRKARARVHRQNLRNVESLEVMDAERLEFPDAAFDVVVAHYVVTAVSRPETALDEFARVLKPGGEIVILSRLGAQSGVRQKVEHLITPITSRLGWRAEFAWDRYLRWLQSSPDIHLLEQRPIPPLGHFSIIRFGKSDARSSTAAS